MSSIAQLKEDLKRLTRLAANVAEAHTCALFLPTGLLTGTNATSTAASGSLGGTGSWGGSGGSASSKGTIELRTPLEGSLPPLKGSGTKTASVELVAAHSLSTQLVRDCRIQVGSGLLGWVVEHGRPIHVAPFDMDSSSLGLYTDSESLKSLVALPVPMPNETSDGRRSQGVLMCDSKKAYSFTKLQVKHLEDLAAEVSRLLFWAIFKRETTATETSWEAFQARAEQLSTAIGLDSIEILRVSIESFEEVERSHSVSVAVQHSEQFMRLVQQALPPHFPLVRMPNGDLLIALDNMMSAFFQTKIKTLADHLSEPSKPLGMSLLTYSAKASRLRALDIDAMLRQSPAVVKHGVSKLAGGARA